MRGFEKGKRVALVISECQKGVIDPDVSMFSELAQQVQERGIVDKIATLAQAFRDHQQPVVHAHVAHRKDYSGLARTSVITVRTIKMGGMREGTIAVEPVPGLLPQEEDVVLSRHNSLVGFNGTDLDSTLRNMGVSTIVFAGVSSNIAIPSMSVCASDFGYQVVIPEDCIAGTSRETHEFTVKNTLPLFTTVTDSIQLAGALKQL